VCLPKENQLEQVTLTKTGGTWKVNKPFAVKPAAAITPAAKP
jgi:hypothetical protein